MSARADLCGGRSAMIVPTATLPKPSQFRLGLSTRDESACVRQSCCRELSIGAFWPKHSLNKLRQSMASASGRVTGFPESGVALVRDGIRMRPRVREPFSASGSRSVVAQGFVSANELRGFSSRVCQSRSAMDWKDDLSSMLPSPYREPG
jgi:hypothetical protein